MDKELMETIQKLNIVNESQREKVIKVIGNLYLSGYNIPEELLRLIEDYVREELDSSEEKD